jgi:hypothetical protein
MFKFVNFLSKFCQFSPKIRTYFCLRFGCGQLKLIVYKGSKDERLELREKFDTIDWNVLLTTFDVSFF